MCQNYDQYLDKVIAIANEASAHLLKFYAKADLIVEQKLDLSPVTEADKSVDTLISTKLKQIQPAWPVVSEEGDQPTLAKRQEASAYWLVDPLDGTREFIEKTDEFSINIALIVNHRPVLGVVAIPVKQKLYFATSLGGAWMIDHSEDKKPIQVSMSVKKPVRVIVSRRQGNNDSLEEFIESIGPVTTLYCGSAFKICLVAEGLADCYPRFGPTQEWDTAAGQCILEAAGGALVDLHGKPLSYNTKTSLMNPPFMAVNHLSLLSK